MAYGLERLRETVTWLLFGAFVLSPSLLTGINIGEEVIYPGDAYLAQFYPDLWERPEVLRGTFPSYPATYVDGRFYLIRGVEVNTPYIIAGGNKHYIRSKESILFIPYFGFKDASADLSTNASAPLVDGEYLAARRPPTQWILTPYLRGGVKRALPVEFEITPDEPLRNAFAAVIFHNDDFETEIFWRPIGSLEAGETRRVQLVTDPIPRGSEMEHNFILIFDRTGEVPTPRRLEIGSSLAATCFRWVQEFNTHYLLRNQKRDLPVVPLLQVSLPVVINDELVTGNARVKAWIDRYGFLKNAEVVKASTEHVKAPAVAMVNRWLFFPKLVEGQFIESAVAIPLHYSSTEGVEIDK